MIEPCIIITNNPLSFEKFKEVYEVKYMDTDVISILKTIRDYIHSGHRILTHPLMSSIKPNETPYRTVLITKNKSNLDMDSLNIIEGAIATTIKFINDFNIPNWSQSILDDFKLIDYDLIKNAIS